VRRQQQLLEVMLLLCERCSSLNNQLSKLYNSACERTRHSSSSAPAAEPAAAQWQLFHAAAPAGAQPPNHFILPMNHLAMDATMTTDTPSAAFHCVFSITCHALWVWGAVHQCSAVDSGAVPAGPIRRIQGVLLQQVRTQVYPTVRQCISQCCI
jgi:hypothetical protein